MGRLVSCMITGAVVWFALLSTIAVGRAQPELESPENDSFINDSTPDFLWIPDNTTDDEIIIRMDNDGDFSSPEYENNLGTGHPNNHTLPDGAALDDGVYYWQIQEIADGFSEIRRFTIDTAGPDAPAYTTVDIPALTLQWSSVRDAVLYILEYSTDNNFPPDATTSVHVFDNSYAMPTLTAGIYFWRVRAIDMAGNEGDPSPVDNFHITGPPPVLGVDFMMLLASGAMFLVVGIAVGWKLLGGREGRIVEALGPRPKISGREAHDAFDRAQGDTKQAGSVLKEVGEYGVDVSAEERMLKSAQEFIETARKEGREGRYDSAFAYSRAASVLGTSTISALSRKTEEAKRAADAKLKAEDDIRAAETAIKEVESRIGEAEEAGIDAKPAASLADLASEIMKSAEEARDPEIYRFQSATAKQIAEHAAAALEGSIKGQKEQVKRTDEALAGAKEALKKTEATIEKQRKEFDTLVPEYWLKVAREVCSIAEDKKLNAEVREAMADTSTRICEWIEEMFERRDIRGRMKKGKGITLR